MGHIPTTWHGFSTSSFRDFVQTDRRTDTQTDAAKNNTCSQHGWRAGHRDNKSLLTSDIMHCLHCWDNFAAFCWHISSRTLISALITHTRPIATDNPLAWCVSLPVTWLLCTKTAKRIEVLFGVENLEDTRHTVLNGDLDLPTARAAEEWKLPIVMSIGTLLVVVDAALRTYFGLLYNTEHHSLKIHFSFPCYAQRYQHTENTAAANVRFTVYRYF